MPGDDLCSYCLVKDLSGLSTYNREKHYGKCKKRNPYPKSRPRIQTKLGFLPVQTAPEPVLEPEPDFQIASGSQVVNEQNISTVSNEWDNIVPDLPMNDLDNDGDISIVDDGGNNNIPDLPQFDLDNDDEIVLVGGVPSISCHGFQPLLAENFYENFAFQLLPTMPHITLCGSSFHHVSCTN